MLPPFVPPPFTEAIFCSTPLRSKTAPFVFASSTWPLVNIGFPLNSLNEPLLISVPPVYVSQSLIPNIPAPVFVSFPAPTIIAFTVKVVELLVLIIPSPVRVIPLLFDSVNVAVVVKIPDPPLLKIILSKFRYEPGVVPNVLSAFTLNIPADIILEPVWVFVPDKVKVPAPALVIVPAPVITPP